MINTSSDDPAYLVTHVCIVLELNSLTQYSIDCSIKGLVGYERGGVSQSVKKKEWKRKQERAVHNSVRGWWP